MKIESISVWPARAIRYQRKGFKPRTLLTSLVDQKLYPADEIVELYHERWEIELGYGEIKTDMLDATTQPPRSKTPQRVRQEIWGILIAYNLIRLEMQRIADEAHVEPTRISFVTVYQHICLELLATPSRPRARSRNAFASSALTSSDSYSRREDRSAPIREL